MVRDCDMVSCHSLLGIGSELSGGVRNVWMTRCTVADTYAMLRIKTGLRRGGFVENVKVDESFGTSGGVRGGVTKDLKARKK